MLMTVQDKSLPPVPAQKSEPAAEQAKQLPDKQPAQKQGPPVVLPTAKSVRVTVQEGPSPAVVIVQPDGERKTLSDDEVRQLLEAGQPKTTPFKTEIVLQNGALYTQLGGVLYPLSGAGASGCFGTTPERTEQIQKEVRIQFEKEKADAEKKK